jgi:hypothetical protein
MRAERQANIDWPAALRVKTYRLLLKSFRLECPRPAVEASFGLTHKSSEKV